MKTKERKEAEDIIARADEEGRDITPEEEARIHELTGWGAGRQVYMNPDGTASLAGSRRPKRKKGGGLPSPEEIEALDDGGYSGLAEFLSDVSGTRVGKYDERLEPLDVRSQQSVGTGAEGGFLVPERFRAEVLLTATTSAPYLAMRDIVMLDGPGSGIVVPKVDDRDRSSNEYGGVALQRVGENAAFTGDQVTFQSEQVALKKAALLVRVSNELMSDAGVNVEQQLRRVFARAVQQRQELDFVNGSGAGEPLGFLNSGALETVTRDTANEINMIDVATMIGRAVPGSLGRSVWLAHPRTAEQVLTLADSNGSNIFIGQNAAQAAPTTLLGKPLFFTSACPVLGSEGDLNLVDPQAYLYLQRPLVVAASQHVDFDSDQTAFRVTLRDDGHPHYDQAVTDEQSQSLSEFVALAA